MADYVANNTRRLKVHYTGPRGSHTMLFRNTGLLSTMASLIASARAVIGEFVHLQVNGYSWGEAEGADEGSDIFLPVVWGSPILSGGGLDADNLTPYGAYAQFVGRSTVGSRASFYLLGITTPNITANNRLVASEDSFLTAAIAALNSSTSNLCAIDKGGFVLKNYCNTGINKHLARVARATA
jgi:hypothetical protein